MTAYDPTEEYVLMATAGLGWREILASLTTSPAGRFGEAGHRGKVSIGMDAEPVKDVRAFAKVRQTIRAGAALYSKPWA